MRTAALLAALSASPVPTPIGVGPAYHPLPLAPAVRAAAPVAGLSCRHGAGSRYGVHVELFANRRVVIVPAGIGIAPPHRLDGAYVRGGRCSYAVRTRAPTGVVEVLRGSRLSLGDLFSIWGRPLTRTRLAGFRSAAGLVAFVDGRRWNGDPRAIPLRRHAEIVLEIGGFVPAHRSFLFGNGP